MIITQFKDPAEIKQIVAQLGNRKMRKHSHDFITHGPIRILDAAKRHVRQITRNARKTPAISIATVVLAANRDYAKHVEKQISNMRKNYPHLGQFKALRAELSHRDYAEFKEIWGHADKKKYDTLKALVKGFFVLKKASPTSSDYMVMKQWAKQARPESRKSDTLGCIPNVGIATFQHLRLAFGADTVKPDLRVKQVLERKFKAKLADDKAIRAVEEIAKITKHKVVEIDQIFVKYGSGYFRA